MRTRALANIDPNLQQFPNKKLSSSHRFPAAF
jgi:hypothetical protein